MIFRLTCLFLCFALCHSNGIIGQNYFEGEIVYKIEYLDIPEEMSAIEDYLPTQMILLSKGTKYKTVNIIPDKSDQINIMDNFDGSGYLLIDFLGHKISLENDVAEVHKANSEYFQSEMESIEENKDILGYSCKKARLTTEKDTTDVFYTDVAISPEFRYVKLRGLPLEYIANQNGLVMLVSAISIEKREVSETEFLIPAEYKIMSKDELEELFKI